MPRPLRDLRTPLLTVDLIIRSGDARSLVLIDRANPPHGWALPGGFVDPGETVAAAARREAAEETGLEVELLALLGAYSDPARDPRGHTVSLVYVADAEGEPEGRDDAREARVFSLASLPELAFDHRRILDDYATWLATGEPAPLGR